jgi:hypothetical protein
MNRALIHVPVRVPDESDFPDDDEFLPDEILDQLLLDVVGAYEALRLIEDHGISIAVRWKKKGGKSQRRLVYAKCVKPSGLLAHFCKVDFVIWVAADNVKIESWSTVQIGKLLYHEARHIGWDPGDDEHDAHAILHGHDVELFLGEVADTGAWERGRDALAKDYQHPDVLARSLER